MTTKTIGITEEVYDKLVARKRDDESFTDLLNRLVEEATQDWRNGFGTLSEEEATELEQRVKEARSSLDEGLTTRQQEAIESLKQGTNQSSSTDK